jgi:hypothetical protein
MTGIAEEAGKLASTTVDAMRSSPLSIALLLVNIGFLGFAGYVLGEVSENARQRNVSQMNLIEKLVTDCRPASKTSDKAGPVPHQLPELRLLKDTVDR